MVRSLARVALAAASVAAWAGTAPAWGNRGHEVVALIAYRELDGSPQTQRKIQEVLKKHEHYESYLARDRPKGVALEDWVVMRAATWADSVRGRPKYHRPTWHYVNKPLVLGADRATRLEVEKAFSTTDENHGDILIAFPECRRTVRDTGADEQERAARLCWVFHLAGDIHQPLHAVAYCTRELPTGDQGGNKAWVRRRAGLNPTRLHALWDHLLDGDGADAEATARDVRLNVTATERERKVGDIGAWAEESYELARTNVYTFSGQPIDFFLQLDRDHDGPSDAPTVPVNYEKEAVKVARKRALLAGLRLADALKADLGD